MGYSKKKKGLTSTAGIFVINDQKIYIYIYKIGLQNNDFLS